MRATRAGALTLERSAYAWRVAHAAPVARQRCDIGEPVAGAERPRRRGRRDLLPRTRAGGAADDERRTRHDAVRGRGRAGHGAAADRPQVSVAGASASSSLPSAGTPGIAAGVNGSVANVPSAPRTESSRGTLSGSRFSASGPVPGPGPV